MRFVLYNHVGSGNHGCEALVRSISHMLGEKDTLLLSDAPEEEAKYGIADSIEVRPSMSKTRPAVQDFFFSYLQLKIRHDYFYMDVLPYKPALKGLRSEDVLVSIGGDIFCYENYRKYNLLHQYALKQVKHSILIGCSIEPDSLTDHALLKDLETFEFISARELITYNALKNAGLKNVSYCPDTAFSLPAAETALPDHFIPQNTVGINISPLVLNKSADAELILENIRLVVRDVLSSSSASVAFVPHVVWENNDDRIPLQKLYQEFQGTGRVCLIEDQDARKLKWIISQCSYFIGARTHATIAAYSTGVPTLALGYSVKSRGIARDLFGAEEHYVLPYQDITSSDMLLKSFHWLIRHTEETKKTLMEKTEIYQREIVNMGSKLKELYGEKSKL